MTWTDSLLIVTNWKKCYQILRKRLFHNVLSTRLLGSELDPTARSPHRCQRWRNRISCCRSLRAPQDPASGQDLRVTIQWLARLSRQGGPSRRSIGVVQRLRGHVVATYCMECWVLWLHLPGTGPVACSSDLEQSKKAENGERSNSRVRRRCCGNHVQHPARCCQEPYTECCQDTWCKAEVRLGMAKLGSRCERRRIQSVVQGLCGEDIKVWTWWWRAVGCVFRSVGHVRQGGVDTIVV